MTVDALAAKLRRLLDEGSVPASSLGARARARLEPLFGLGALVEERAGRGRRVVLAKPEMLRAWVRSQYPSGLQRFDSELPPRAAAVLRTRDSKKGGDIEHCPVMLRGFEGVALERHGQRLEVAHLTAAWGLVAVDLIAEGGWCLPPRVATVENLEVFMAFEALGSPVPLALYAAGRLPGRVIEWLAEAGETEVLHFGDYDPVGLSEFVRLREALGERACLFVPEDLEALVARYGQEGLYERSATWLPGLRASGVPEVLEVLAVLDRYGRGVEQEVLLAVASG